MQWTPSAWRPLLCRRKSKPSQCVPQGLCRCSPPSRLGNPAQVHTTSCHPRWSLCSSQLRLKTPCSGTKEQQKRSSAQTPSSLQFWWAPRFRPQRAQLHPWVQLLSSLGCRFTLAPSQPSITPALCSAGANSPLFHVQAEDKGMVGPPQPTLCLDSRTSCPLTSLLQPGGQSSTPAPSVL